MYKVNRYDDIDQERRKIAKVVRSAIRLHFSLAADDYVNQILPDILDAHELAVERGEEFVLDLAQLDYPQLGDGS